MRNIATKSHRLQAYDVYRDQVLRDQGIRVLQFWNSEVEQELEKVLLRISKAIDEQKTL